MSTVSPPQLAREVHAQSLRLVIAVTGGGSQAISTLLSVPGASRTVLEATVPYAPEALTGWLGVRPEEFCSGATARAMAMAAFLRARTYDPTAATCGVACTAGLASDRPKRGPHRAHLAFQTASTTATVSVELAKGTRSREEEEAVVAALLLNHVANACGLTTRLSVPLVDTEQLESQRVVAPRQQQDLLAGRAAAVPLHDVALHEVSSPTGRKQSKPRAVFPGAFNPLHQGHRKMHDVAATMLGHDVDYEISIVNVDKPPLDFVEIDRRGRQFGAGEAVWLSRAPRFWEKAQLFPGATFVVGADTIERIGQPRYYGGDEAAMHRALATIAAAGCRFLVFGRTIEGRFRALADLALPAPLAALCDAVPEEQFREDVSSTQLRRQPPPGPSDPPASTD